MDPPTPAEMRGRYANIAGGGFPYLAAEADGQVIAYAYANQYRPRPAYRYTVEDSIYVSPEHQGKGVGRLLLGELIRESRERGFRQMIAVIGDSGNAASIRLHEALDSAPPAFSKRWVSSSGVGWIRC